MKNLIFLSFMTFAASLGVAQSSLNELSDVVINTSLYASKSMESRYYLMKARNAVAVRNWDLAIDHLEKSIELDKSNRASLELAADILYSTDKKKQALGYYQRALSAGKEEGELLYKLGKTSLELGLDNDAIDYFNRTLMLDGAHPMAYIGRGEAKLNLELYDAAISDFNSALQIDENFAQAYRGKGFAFTKQGNYYNGIKELNRAIELSPEDGLAYYYRGLTYIRSYNEKKACEDLNKALTLGIDAAKKDIKKTCKGLK